MADESENYPRLPARHWWAIRDRLKRSVPSAITAAYIESALAVEQGTARELLTQLQYLGLVDENGKPTDVAEDWRHDETYKKACASMLASVYPSELRDAAGTDRDAAQRWFARKKKVGENAALKMAITYQLVANADLANAPDPARATNPKAKAERPARAVAERKPAVGVKAREEEPPPSPPGGGRTGHGPSLHVDVQVHIAADASAEQIDQIFASMAKHLYPTTRRSE